MTAHVRFNVINMKERMESIKVVLIAPLHIKNIHGEKIRNVAIKYFEEFSDTACEVLTRNPIKKKPTKAPNSPKFQYSSPKKFIDWLVPEANV